MSLVNTSGFAGVHPRKSFYTSMCDQINAWLYETNRDRSVREVLRDSRQVFEQLVAAIEAFDEAELLDPHRFPWWEGELLSAAALFAHFHEEHEPDMRAWLARQESSVSNP